MNRIAKTAFVLAAFLLPAAARAHPGPHHDDLGWSFLHALTEPDHLLTMALVLVWAAMVASVAYWFKPWRAASWR